MKTREFVLLVAAVLLAGMGVAAAAEDIVIEDFEHPDYGAWEVEGTAFGPGPAQGTLPGQMEVTGFQGERLVNSFFEGDDSTGTLTSPPFTIERKRINFLIGGGGHELHTCVNLLVDGKTVRTATGTNIRSGGSEALRWTYWDVEEFLGQQARIQIVDRKTGTWGHINADHFVQSDTAFVRERTRELVAEKRYLNLPVENGAPKKWIRLLQDGEIVREFDIELATAEPDFWVVLDLSQFAGETLTLWGDQIERDAKGFEAITQADKIIGGENLYRERYRPQFHFSSRRGWNNDPNGMVYYDGEYHLFYQHNPYGWNWGNMTWGHAVSKDLVHWEELEDAIHPDELGTIFSGSAVVDHKNTTGFQTGAEKPIVCVYTYAGGRSRWSEGEPFTQAIAYSTDRGRTWTKYSGNPVQGHISGNNRDPKAFWHEPIQKWVIVLYLDDARMGFFTSDDLKSWEMHSELKCFHECPELFALPVDGNTEQTKWVLYGGSGEYLLGSFDGQRFVPDGEAIQFHYGDCFYASQTFNNVPESDGRRIQIAWGRTGHPDMPFNQMMDFPVELTLHTTEEGVRMFAEPVREIELLHQQAHEWSEVKLESETKNLAGLAGGLFDIRAGIEPGGADFCGFRLGGCTVTYDPRRGELRCGKKKAPLTPVDGAITLQLLVDRLSVEIFANGGRVYMPMAHVFESIEVPIKIFSKGGACTFIDLNVFELKSAW